jgi:potassium channel subfamily K
MTGYRPPPIVVKAVLVTLTYLSVGVVLWTQIEGWDPVAALYFTFVTLTTVGYGDFYPESDTGKVVGVLFAFVGIGMIAVAIGIITAYVDDLADEQAREMQGKMSMSPAERKAEEIADHKRFRLTRPQWALVKIFCCVNCGAVFHCYVGGYGALNAVYMSGITVMTVGYGDMSPMDTLSGNVTRACPAYAGCAEAGVAAGTYVETDVAVCKEPSIPGEFVARCYGMFFFSIVWIMVSVVLVGDAIGSVQAMYLDAKREKKRQRILAKKLTVEDLQLADDDNSGTVTEAEFILYKLEMMELIEMGTVRTIKAQFRNIDADGSGSLTFEDIELAYKEGRL